MDESPLVSPTIKQYIIKHNLEENINQVINDVLKKLPDDPYSIMSSFLQNYSSSVFTVEYIRLEKILSNDFKGNILMEIVMNYKGNSRKCLSNALSMNTKLFENINTNSDKIFQIFKKYFTNYSFDEFSNYDKILKGIYEDLCKIDSDTNLIAKFLSNAISLGLFISQSIVQEIPLKSSISSIFKDSNFLNTNSKENIEIPNLGFCIFKCGKSMNSKVKFERFFLIINNDSKMNKHELQEIIGKLYTSLRKILSIGKQGELGMKLNIEGCYLPPNDTLNDVMKLLEEVIKDTGENHKISIGIDCNANNYYNESTKKYELDGFKKPPESDELIDYYLKYCQEHPMISYLEDPISDYDLNGWKKILAKFKTAKNNPIISTKTLINDSHSKLIQLTNDEEINVLSFDKSHLQFMNISFKVGESVTVSELFESYKYIRSKLDTGTGTEGTENNFLGLTIYDNVYESDQVYVIDLALALRAKFILLHGISNKSERVCKINRYINIIEDLY